MAGDWLKLRADIEQRLDFSRLTLALCVTDIEALGLLWKVSNWFERHGEYGAMKVAPSVVDAYVGKRGLSAAMVEVGYIIERDGWLTLHRFCTPARRSLGAKERAALIGERNNYCESCGSTDRLEIDHYIPVCRGGRSNPENLRVLCFNCNRKKGRKQPT